VARQSPSRSTRSERGARSRPRTRADGKVDVFCPQCGAQYRIAGDALETKLQCGECDRTFFPKTAVGKRPRPKDNSKAYFGVAAAVVLIIGSFVLIKSGGTARAAPPTAPEEKSVDLAHNPRTLRIVAWAQRVAAGDSMSIRDGSDMEAMQKFFGIEPDKSYAATAGGDRDQLDAAILAAFKTDKKTRFFRQMSCDYGTLTDPIGATADTGSVVLNLSPKPEFTYYNQRARCDIVVDFRIDKASDMPKVTGWQVKMPPLFNGRDPEKPLGEDEYIPHAKIAAPKVVTGADGITNTESPPVALDHLPETPADMRKQIDDAVAEIIRSADPDSPGPLFNRTVAKMKTFLLPGGDPEKDAGRPAVPRLLNAMYEMYGDVAANNMKLSQVDRCLRQLTGCAFDYQVTPSADPNKDNAVRQAAIRRWFAFWQHYHKGNFTKLIEKEEDLTMPKATNDKASAPKVDPKKK
jgi:hypothetical protein